MVNLRNVPPWYHVLCALCTRLWGKYQILTSHFVKFIQQKLHQYGCECCWRMWICEKWIWNNLQYETTHTLDGTFLIISKQMIKAVEKNIGVPTCSAKLAWIRSTKYWKYKRTNQTLTRSFSFLMQRFWVYSFSFKIRVL